MLGLSQRWWRGGSSTSPETPVYRPQRFVAGGETIGREPDGRIVFIRGGIPGDQVTVLPVEDGRDWTRSVVDEVLVSSPDRVLPPCPQRRRGCGGCDWQHVRVGAQLPAKVDIVRDALRRTAKLAHAEVRSGRSVSAEGYRTTVRVVGDQDSRAAYRKERSHDTVASAPCLIAHPYLQDLLASVEITPGLEVTLRVSEATGEATATWNSKEGEVSGLPASVSSGPGAFLTEVVAGHDLRVSARSFFQSGPEAAGMLVDAVREMAPELLDADIVVDAYAGVGLFGVAATAPHSRIISIESSASAVEDARFNLAGRITHTEKGDVGKWRYARERPVDVVIADPSRIGLRRAGVKALATTRAPVLVLVSCDPVALARDTNLLRDEGYTYDGTQVYDLFPHTHHVECVTRFIQNR